jgi:hypothetical protein
MKSDAKSVYPVLPNVFVQTLLFEKVARGKISGGWNLEIWKNLKCIT